MQRTPLQRRFSMILLALSIVIFSIIQPTRAAQWTGCCTPRPCEWACPDQISGGFVLVNADGSTSGAVDCQYGRSRDGDWSFECMYNLVCIASIVRQDLTALHFADHGYYLAITRALARVVVTGVLQPSRIDITPAAVDLANETKAHWVPPI